MITQDSISSKAEISSGITTSNFTIKSSPAAFRILASGLYANKVRSIIRELSCNARDSHVASGNTDPWEIHLPTAYEPYFSVKDHGVGLSHDEVISVYTTFFESTKTDSDDYVGCLGLGSKSPFSYTDNFTITAIKDGALNVYSAFIDDTGLPAVAHLGSDTTDQRNGVEVRFAVKTNDFNLFTSEAQHALQWFDQMPTGNITVRVPRVDRTELIDGVVVEVNQQGGSVAIMGGVAYPIDAQHPKLKPYEYLLGNHKLVLRFDIGELEVQPSREGLSYINMTVDAICDRLLVIERAITKHCETQLASATTIFEKILVRNKLTNSNLTYQVAKRVYHQQLEEIGLIDQYPTVEFDRVSLSHDKYDMALVRKYASPRYQTGVVPKKVDLTSELSISLSDLALGHTAIVYNDAGVTQKDLIEHIKRMKSTTYVFNKPVGDSKFNIDGLIIDLCGYAVKRTSEMGIERTQRNKTVKHSGIYRLMPTSSRDAKLTWQKSEVSDLTGLVYVNLTNRQLDGSDTKFRAYEYQLNETLGRKLIGIATTSTVDKSTAIPLDQYLEDWVRANINDQSIAALAGRTVPRGHSVPYGWDSLRELLLPVSDKIDDPVLKAMCLAIKAEHGPMWDKMSHLLQSKLTSDQKTIHDQMVNSIYSCFNKYQFVDFSLSSKATPESKLKFVTVLNFVYNLSTQENSK